MSQTNWVTPGQPFVLDLRTGIGTPPASQLGIDVTVYSCLSSVSAFDQTLSASGPSGPKISETSTPLSLDQLQAGRSGFVLSMPVETSGQSIPTASGFTIDLTSSSQQCGGYPSGVYPVRLQLVDTRDGQNLGGLTTHLIYTGVLGSTQRLRLALVVPVATAIKAARSPTQEELAGRPASALANPSPGATTALAAEVRAVVDHPSIPLTLAVDPQTVVSLAGTGHQATVGRLAGLATTPGVHQFLSTPFVPVDAAQLVGAGLDGELARQVGRGGQVLDAELGRAVVPTSPPLGPWFTTGAISTSTLGALRYIGYEQLVLPGVYVAGSPTNGSSAQPFTIGGGHSPSMTAFTTNSDLAARLSGTPTDPVLEVHQFLAELAQIYFEKPNDTVPRAVAVSVPPTGSQSSPLLNALLGSLVADPLVEPVTTSGLFATFGGEANCRSSCRLTGSVGTGGLPASAVRTQRTRIDQLGVAAPTAKGTLDQLGQLVLAGESALLRPAQRAAVLGNARRAVDAQLGQLTVGQGSITLASQRGRIPVAIQSDAPYPVTAQLTLTSDKLLFASGTTQWTTTTTLLPSHTNVVYADVTARAAGLFRVSVTLHSPTGGLLLSSGEVTIRSTASSVVGVVLSIGAVIVLAAWWIRTSRKRRRERRVSGANRSEDDQPSEIGSVGP